MQVRNAARGFDSFFKSQGCSSGSSQRVRSCKRSTTYTSVVLPTAIWEDDHKTVQMHFKEVSDVMKPDSDIQVLQRA